MDQIKQPRKVGPIIAVFAIVIALAVIAIILFASKSDTAPKMRSSDDIKAIQADLEVSTKGIDNQNF